MKKIHERERNDPVFTQQAVDLVEALGTIHGPDHTPALAAYNRRMSQATSKKKLARPGPTVQAPGHPAKPAAASRLRVQTRKMLGKHYRAKYGVR